jgi:hypothetical protein
MSSMISDDECHASRRLIKRVQKQLIIEKEFFLKVDNCRSKHLGCSEKASKKYYK